MDEQQKPPREAKGRRPYAKPELRSFELFERRSLACTQTPLSGRTPGCGVFHSSVA